MSTTKNDDVEQSVGLGNALDHGEGREHERDRPAQAGPADE